MAALVSDSTVLSPPQAPSVLDASDAHWLACLMRHRANLKAAHVQVTTAGRVWAIRDLDQQIARANEDIAYLLGVAS